jgi:hypothetical protein
VIGGTCSKCGKMTNVYRFLDGKHNRWRQPEQRLKTLLNEILKKEICNCGMDSND